MNVSLVLGCYGDSIIAYGSGENLTVLMVGVVAAYLCSSRSTEDGYILYSFGTEELLEVMKSGCVSYSLITEL